MKKPEDIKILVACEESQRVCIAFRERGFEAYSCDVQDCSGGHPEWHIKGDVTPLLGQKWDLIIAHPPCTYLSNAGSGWLRSGGVLNEERLRNGIQAGYFFMMFYYANCKHIAIENPVPNSIYCLPKYTQIIQPWQFGHPFQKRTCLWLFNLPELLPTDIVEERQSTAVSDWFNRGRGKERQKNRSKTFPGIAKAMAEQWGDYLLSETT